MCVCFVSRIQHILFTCFYYYIYCVYATCVCAFVCYGEHAGSEETCGNRFSHSTMAGLRGETQVTGLGGEHACLLSHLTSWYLFLLSAVYYKHLCIASVSGVPQWWSVAVHSFQIPLTCRQPELPDPDLG